MNCDIFIRSYYKDFQWLAYCLQAIKKYCSGFRDILVIVPESSKQRLEKVNLPYDRLFYCRDYGDDYLGQQVTKLFADTYTDADYVCHVDSDCIMCRKVTPDDLFSDGKVEIAFIPYHYLSPSIPWRSVTEKFLKGKISYDFMQRQPHTFPRWLYQEIRDYAQTLHGTDLASYIMAQPRRGFSEFNALGAYAYFYHRDKFAWFDMSHSVKSDHFCKWYWSWGGIQPKIRDEIQKILA